MAALSFSQLEGYWVQAGGDRALAPLMAAVALAESSGDPTATNPTDDNGRQTSWGLWQISNGDHSEPDPNWSDPLVNARLAVGKIKSQGLGAWGTYTSGAYKRYLQSGVAPTTPPAGGAPGGGGSTPSGGGVSQASASDLFGGWLGSLVAGPIGGTVAGLGGILGTIGAPVANSATDFSHALSTGMSAVLWLVNPRNWVRIIAGIVGALAVTVGTVLIVRSSL